MNKENEFFISVLDLMPEGAVIYIQSPSLEIGTIINIWKETEFDYFKSIELTTNNKNIVVAAVLNENFQFYIQSVEIRYQDNLLFEGFDGVEFGTISRSVKLPENFETKYIDDDFCNVSDDW